MLLKHEYQLYVLVTFGGKEAITIMILRTIIGSIFGGNIFGFLFSLAGGLLSNISMILLYNYFKDDISIPWLSIAGAIFHNIGQLLIASIVIGDFRMYIYLPVLMIAAVITGYFTGIVCYNLKKRKLIQ